jgi:methanogenic corrinoid protein MtbC1
MTGLSADILRAWERRYHLPEPERTPGGQRIYSQRDISILQWLTAKQSEGLSISNSVGLWNELVNNGVDPLAEAHSFESDQPTIKLHGEMGISSGSLRGQWKQACLEFKENLADQVINKAFAISSPETVCTEILLKGLSELGEGWYRGEVTVQQEHFASGIALRRLGSLISSTPPSNRNETILICCSPGERHSLPTTYLTFLLRRRGYKVIELGADVPQSHLQETVKKIHPQLVILSAQQLVNAVQLKRSAQALINTVPVGYGGRIFTTSPSLNTSIPATYLGDTLEEAPGIIENFINNKSTFRMEETINPYQDLYELFELKLQTTFSLISELNSTWDSSEGSLSAATHFTNNAVSAALTFGNLDLLLPELDWVEGFLTNHHYRKDQIVDLWHRYTESIRKVMGQGAAPLINWFDLYLSRQETPGKHPPILSQFI